MATPKKSGSDAVDLAIVFGPKPKGGRKPPAGGDMDDDYDDESYEETAELPPDFEAYAVEAFPELEGQPERQMSLWKAVKACVKAGGM